MKAGCVATGAALAAMFLAAPAQAQREAVASDLSPQAVADIFGETVSAVCVASLAAGVDAPKAGGARIAATSDVEIRKLAGAAPGDAVFDVTAARGVATVHEGAGKCVVSAYGPPAAATLAAAAARLSQQGFSALAEPANSAGVAQKLTRIDGGQRIEVVLSGSEPGMPGHKSRFSVVTAQVSAK
jgi:hypothetical protein